LPVEQIDICRYLALMIISRCCLWVTLFFLILVLPGRSEERSQRLDRPRYTFVVPTGFDIENAENHLDEVRLRLAELLGDSLSYRPMIHIATRSTEFDSLIGGYFPDWGTAAAIPVRHMIVIKSPDHFNLSRSFEEVLAHEYAHLALTDRVDFHPIPRWFNEGLAMLVSMEWSWSDNLAMSKAAVFGQFVNLSDIERVNRYGSTKAQVCYAESYLAVKYLFDDYGNNAVNVFLDQLAVGASEDAALMAATGSNLNGFQAEVWAGFRTRFNVVSLFMDTLLFWLALAVVVVVGAILNIRKRRKFYRQWEEDEKLHSTDFDYGDPDNPEAQDDEDEPWRN